MADIINTKKRDYKYNGPVESTDYNLRIEENYRDLVYLYNKASLLDNKLAKAFERVIKDQLSLVNAIGDLEDRLESLESSSNTMSLTSFSQLDYATFADTSFAISATDLLHFDPKYNILTLPKVNSSSYSRVKFLDPISGQVVPPNFKSKIQNTYPGVDTTGAVVETTPVYNSVLDSIDKIWQRTIVAPSSSASGAQLMLYMEIPTDVAASIKSNYIQLTPFPVFGVDITSIEYTGVINPSLSSSDGWTPLNRSALYDGEQDAVSNVPPGGWNVSGSDQIDNCGPVKFFFPDTDITAIRIKMKKRDYFLENSKYIYSYGLSDFDIGYCKTLVSGRTIVKYTPKNGDTISNILSVTPKIYNVPRSLISSCFSYRIIYESGGTYSTVNPGSSNSVWIEVTLNKLDDTTAPVLTDLIINYD